MNSSLRYALTIILCMGILTGWSFLNRKEQVPPQNRPAEPRPAAPAMVEKEPPTPRAAEPAAPEPELPEKSVDLSVNGVEGGKGERLRLTVENRFGGLARVALPAFESRDGKGELVLITGQKEGPVTLGLWAGAQKFERKVDRDLRGWELEPHPEGPSASLTRAIPGELVVRKELKGVPGHYHLEIELSFENRSAARQKVQYRLRGPVGLTSESLRAEGTDLRLILGRRAGERETAIEGRPIDAIKGEFYEEQVVLIGSSNNYFAAVLAAADAATSAHLKNGFAETLPSRHHAERLARGQFGRPWEELDAAQRAEVEKNAYRTLHCGFASREIHLNPGEKVTERFLLFLGPRDEKVLALYPQLNLTAINDYGWWTVLVKLFLQILKAFHAVFRSWGAAIIGLTVLVRLCLHPLNRRQQVSMMRYQKKVSAVKPQLDELKERYASNPMRRNQEMQKLFKEQGINPGQMMGGCLMIFLQLPVWYALYNSIEYSLDLRRAPFLWIDDLTQPDRAIPLPFAIPLLGWTEINLLPIIYVILTILQQKMQPKPSDPQMQQQMKMMTFMMVFFGFIFYSFPAGFLLYFIASAAIGMLESKIIKRMLAREGLVLSPAGGPGAPSVQVPGSRPALYPARNPRVERRKKT